MKVQSPACVQGAVQPAQDFCGNNTQHVLLHPSSWMGIRVAVGESSWILHHSVGTLNLRKEHGCVNISTLNVSCTAE